MASLSWIYVRYPYVLGFLQAFARGEVALGKTLRIWPVQGAGTWTSPRIWSLERMLENIAKSDA